MSQSSPRIPRNMEEVIAEVETYMETLVTEDDEPVDNIYSDIQRRLLVEPLRSSWRPLDENGARRKYLACYENYFPEVGLGLTLWEGSYEDSIPVTWLRWRDAQGNLIATGAEQSERAALLAEKLRELGIDPNSLMPGKK